MKYSFIVAAYNRKDDLKELAESLERVDYPQSQFELIIADDGSTDGTGEYFDNVKMPFYLVYAYQENKGPAGARNLGMSKAQGQYFLFIDSDSTVPSDYLSEVDAFLEKGEWDGFGGSETYSDDFSPLLKAIHYVNNSFIGAGRASSFDRTSERFIPRIFNMGIRRKVYEQIGGMQEGKQGHVLDYPMEIIKAGFKLGRVDSAKLYYKRRTTFKRFYKKTFNRAIGRVNLVSRHPELKSWLNSSPALLLPILIVLVLLAPFFTWAEGLFYVALVFAVFLALYVLVEAGWLFKSIKVGLLASISVFVQLFAYALGTWSGWLQKWSGKKKAVGFIEGYYN